MGGWTDRLTHLLIEMREEEIQYEFDFVNAPHLYRIPKLQRKCKIEKIKKNQSTRESGGNRTKIIEISKSYEIFFLLVHTGLECITVIQMKFYCFYFHLSTHLERVCPSVSPSVDSPDCMHVSKALWYRTATSHQNHIFSQAWVYGSD